MPRCNTVRASPDHGRRALASCRAVICYAVILVVAVACGADHPGPWAQATPSANPLAGLTAGQIARKAIADLATVSSVHITGSAGQDGQIGILDLILGARGCQETFRIPGQGSSVITAIGKVAWFKMEGPLWKQFVGTFPAKVRGYLAGKYLRAADVPGGMAGLCGLGQAASAFGAELEDLVTAKITTISGQPALQLADKRHSTSGYVTISARPELLRLGVKGREHTDFTGYNQPVMFTPPPAHETVTPAQLGGSGHPGRRPAR
jgi:hypothetical protein